MLDSFHFGDQISQGHKFRRCTPAGQDNFNSRVLSVNDFFDVFEFGQSSGETKDNFVKYQHIVESLFGSFSDSSEDFSDGGFGFRFRPVWHKWRKTTSNEAAGFVVRSYLLCLNEGIRHVFWYAWDNGAMGLAENKGKIQKPAARGYARAREWLIGASFAGCSQTGGGLWQDAVWRCELERDGKKQWVVWSEEEQEFSVPPDWKALTVQGLFDASSKPVAGATSIGPLPVLLSR